MRKLKCHVLCVTLIVWIVVSNVSSIPTSDTSAVPTRSISPLSAHSSTSPPKSSSKSSSTSSSSSTLSTATSTSTSSSSAQPSSSLTSSPDPSLPDTSPPNPSTPESPSSSPLSASDIFYNLTKEFWQWKIKDFPQFATSVGINDDTAGHLDKLNPQHFQQRKLKCEDFLQRAQQINSSTFSEWDLLNYMIFKEDLNTYLRNFKYLKFFTPVSIREGPQQKLKILVKKNTILKSLSDYQKLLSRYGEFPRQTQEILNVMKEQMTNGLMPSNWSLIGVSGKFDSLQVAFNESVFYEPFLNITLNITTQQKEALMQQGKQRVQQDLLPSFKKIRDFIEMEYFPAARSEEGVSSLPGGLDFYKACLKFHTTTDLTPQQIHNLGLSEVARIKEEVKQTAVELGMAGKTLSEISQIVKDDPSQQFKSKEDLLTTYRDAVYNTLYPLMDQVVNNVPHVNISVEENVSGAGYASYNDPPIDGSRPGTFFINAKIYKAHKRYEVTALSLHESVPGHHLQAVNLIWNPAVPEFRKFPDFCRYSDIPAKFPMHTAFSEGWGLYSEYLGNELGLYKDPYQKFGRHSWELLRACRLVVDTGLHALGWTRQEAINYLLENTAMSEEAIKGQIDRYITWPGQACSYKIGEIKIKELRKKAENELGNLFRVQDFHGVVLGCVGPLNILEKCVDSYISKTIH